MTPLPCDRCKRPGQAYALPSLGGLDAEKICAECYDADEKALRPFAMAALEANTLAAIHAGKYGFDDPRPVVEMFARHLKAAVEQAISARMEAR